MADGKVVIETDLDSSGAEAGLTKLERLAKTGLGAVTKAATVTATALTAAGTAATIVGSNFEEGMSKVAAISGATGADFEKLKEKAKQMGATTKFSATEAASAFEYMAMAGWKTTDMLGGIDGVMNLAAASGEDLALVSDIVTDAITAFGLSASDSGHFADVLAAASSNANTNVSMLGESFKYVAPIAGAMKYSVEDTSLALGLMANASIKGSMAGTSLKTSLANLASPTDSMAEVMEKYGISLTNADGSMKSLREVIDTLRSKMGGLDEATQTAAASTLFGKEAMAGMLAIINASEADYKKLASAVNNADGTAKNMADTMQDNLKGSITILKSSLEGLGIQIYESMETSLKNAANTGIKSVERISGAFKRGGLSGSVKEAGKMIDEFTDKLSESGEMAGDIIKPLKNVAKQALSLGKTALPVLSKGFTIAVKSLDKFIPLAIAGYTAMKGYAIVSNVTKIMSGMVKAYKAASTAINAYNVIQIACTAQGVVSNATLTVGQAAIGLLTGRVALATAAQTAWNAVMNANPIGIVITLIGTLVAGIGAYNLITGEAVDVTSGLSDKQKKVIENSKDAISSIKQEAEARKENLKAATAEIDTAESLWGELQKCVDVNGRVKEGYEARAQYISGELSNALGIEIGLVDGIIENYDKLNTSIKEVIASKKASAILEAMDSDYTNAMREQGKIAAQVANDYDALSESKKRQVEIEAELAKEAEKSTITMTHTGEEVKVHTKRYYELSKELDKVTGEVKTNRAAFDASSAAMKDNEKVISDYNLMIEASASKNTETINNALAEIQSGIDTSVQASSEAAYKQTEDVGNLLLNIIKAQEEGIAAIQQETIDGTAQSMGIALNTMSDSSENMKALMESIGHDGAGKLIEAMKAANMAEHLSLEAQAGMEAFITAFEGLSNETYQEGSEAMTSFAQGIFSQTGSSQAAGTANALAANRGVASIVPTTEGKTWGFSFGSGITNAASTVSKAGLTAATAAKTSASTVNPAPVGTKFVTDLSSGMLSKNSILSDAGKKLAESAKTSASTVNPSGTGKSFGTTYAAAVSGTQASARSAGTGIANAANNGLNSVSAHSAGANFGSGFGGGIRSAIGNAVSAASSLAQSALSAVKNKLDIHSPSKETTKLGEFTGDGMPIGIRNKIPEARKASGEMSDAILEGLDIEYQLGRMRTAMNMEKMVIGSNMTMKVVHEYVLGNHGDMNRLSDTISNMKIRMTKEDITSLAREFAMITADNLEGMGISCYDREFARVIRRASAT